MSNWLTTQYGNDVAAFKSTSGYAEWKRKVGGEYESLLDRIKQGSEYHEYQWLIGRLSGIELVLSMLDELVTDGEQVRDNIV